MLIGARVLEQEFAAGRGSDPFPLDATPGGGGAR